MYARAFPDSRGIFLVGEAETFTRYRRPRRRDSLSQLFSVALLFSFWHHLCIVRHSIFNGSASLFPVCLQLDFHFVMPCRAVRVLEEHTIA